MCILLLSTAHPEYDLVLLSNRDEYFSRPTEPISRHATDETAVSHIYGRDALRGGTWLAVSTTGRFAALTNFRTPADKVEVSALSRGSLPLSFLQHGARPREYAESLLRDPETAKVGGFSLLCGDLRCIRDGVVVVSNQSADTQPITTFARNPSIDSEPKEDDAWSCELSNSLVSVAWTKVTLGRQFLRDAIQQAIEAQFSRQQLVESLFEVLSRDTIKEHTLAGLAESVFIPQFSTGGDIYGTRQQTVWLLKGDTLTVVERTIHPASREKTQVTLTVRIG